MKTTKNYLFCFILLILVLPFAQYMLLFTSTPILHGEGPKPNIDFVPPKWDSGEFQEVKEAYLTHNFGFRGWIIRIHNELEYQLFGKINRVGGRLGKDNYLFDQEYINEYTGKDFIGDSAITVQMQKLQGLKDSLAKRNILLLVIFAPSKAHFCSEYLPKGSEKRGEKIHYDYMTRACKQRNIPYIDFNDYFLSLKNKTPYPLFIRTGIHWTKYGAAMAMDSIFKRMEAEKKVDMPDFDWSEIEISDKARGTDEDLMNLANMFSYFKHPTLAYPKLKFSEAKSGQQKLKTLTAGDSFWWDIYWSGANESLFGKSEFWCYSEEIFPKKEPWNVANYSIRREMEKYEVIIIESTGCNLFRLSFGFIEKAYESYLHPKATDFTSPFYEQKVAASINTIRNNTKWLNELSQVAEKEKISLDSMVKKTAINLIE